VSDSIPDEAVEFLRKSNDFDSHNRQEGLDDLRFSYGDQWSQVMQQQRALEKRPYFVINETDAYVRQICNQMRQQRPRIKAHGVNSQADAKTAEVITGITRHIEELSDADNAYDTAGEFAVRMGWGYWRLDGDYVKDDSFDQDIRIKPIFNPFSVSFDPYSLMPDGSDQTQCLISDTMPKEEFRRIYPDADESNFTARAVGDTTGEWLSKDSIRVAQFYRIEQERERLIKLSDDSTWWKDEMPDVALLEKVGVTVKGERMSWRKKVRWYRLTAVEVLEGRVLPGRYIPVVPVYGANLMIDGKLHRFGVVRMAKDPQRMLNFWQSAITELVALAPKAKWIAAEEAIGNREDEWINANVTAYALLRYQHKDEGGEPIPMPQRTAPEPPPQGAMAAAQLAHDNLQRVLGMFDPAMRTGGQQSGKALNAEQQQSDMSNYHFYDNLTRSIKHTGRIILDWIPSYYSKKRVMRIIGEDGKPDLITINDSAAVDAAERRDVTAGEYDIVMETGPGYNSKRQEAVEAMAPLLQGPNNELMKIAGDLFFRNQDFPGADLIADRLKANNPLAQIDDKSDVPPQAQMMIKKLQQQLQQMQQQLQAAGMQIKSRSDIEGMKEAAESHRTDIREKGETARAHLRASTELQREQIEDATWRFDIESKVHGAQSVEEIKAVVQLLLHHLSAKEAEKVAGREEAQTAQNGAA
jgi:hypothetical protein